MKTNFRSLIVFLLTVALLSVALAPVQGQDRERVPVEEQQYIWVAANVAHPFYAEGLAGWNAAADMLGVQADLVGPVTADVQQQITIIEQAIANPTTAGILIYSVDDNALEPVLQRAREAGIPVITGNGELRNRDIRDAFVGTANTALGSTAADLVAEALGGEGQVGIVSFISAQNHQERVAGFEARIAERYPDIEVLGVAPGDGTPESSRSAAAAFLQANPDVDMLWSTDASSGAVAQAIRESGMAGQVLSVGTDRTEDQIAAIQDGTVYATIVQDTFAEEFTSLNFLYWLYNGESTVPDSCTTRPAVITAENVEQLTAPREMQEPGDVSEQQYIWVAANVAHPFYAEGLAGWNAAADMLGVQADLVGPVTADVQQQITIIEQAIANPTTAGILIYSVDDNALEPVLQRAREAGIPVITGNGELRNRDIRDAFVGTANTALGSTAADLVAEALGGEGQVGIVSFISAQNHQERVAGFEARIAERYPDIEVLGVAPGDGTPESSRSAAAAFLQANPDVDMLWSTDASSGAVAQAIRESGMAEQVRSVGTDRTEDQLAAIRDGTVYATIVQDTFAEEFTSLNFLYWLRNGISTVPDSCTTRPAVITAENVDSL